jgi:hypothetical protein
MSAAPSLEARYLPPILQEIAALIGLPATLQIIAAYGGTRLYVPKRFDPDHPLVKLVGHAAAAKMVEIYGGMDHFDIPAARRAAEAVRNERIRAERRDGATQARLAVKWGISERWIRTIVGPETDDSQLRMF